MRYFLFLLVLVGFKSLAQQEIKVGVVGMGGYAFRCSYYGDYGQITFSDGGSYGAMLTVSPNEHVEIGFNYLHQDTEADQKNYYPEVGEQSEYLDVPVGMNFYQISIIKNLILKTDKVVPYAGIDLGIVDVRKKDGTYNSVSGAWCLKAGLKFPFSEALHLRLQAQMQMPIGGVGVGVGTGGVSAGFYSTMIQFSFVGGLGYTFGSK